MFFIPDKISTQIFVIVQLISLSLLLFFGGSLWNLIPLLIPTGILWGILQEQEDLGNIKNCDQSTTDKKLKYNMMELILKILSSTESTIHESKTTTYQIDVTYQDQVFTINSDGTVYYGKDKVMIEDSYGKYLYKYIQENWKTLLTTKNIIKNISGTLITEDQVIARLEQDIRTALDDTKQINFYLEQIQVIRAKYLNQYKNIKLHKSNSKTEIIKEDTKTNSTSKVLVRA